MEESQRLLDVLVEAGFFERADALDMADPHFDKPTMAVQVHTGKGFFQEAIPWGYEAVPILEKMRKALKDGTEAAKTFDRIVEKVRAKATANATAPAPAVNTKESGTEGQELEALRRKKAGDSSLWASYNFPNPAQSAVVFLEQVPALSDRDLRRDTLFLVRSLLDDARKSTAPSQQQARKAVGARAAGLIVGIMKDDPNESVREEAAKILLRLYRFEELDQHAAAIHEAARKWRQREILFLYAGLPSCKPDEVKSWAGELKPNWEQDPMYVRDAIIARHGDKEAEQRLIVGVRNLQRQGDDLLDQLRDCLALVSTPGMQRFLAENLRSPQEIALPGGGTKPVMQLCAEALAKMLQSDPTFPGEKAKGHMFYGDEELGKMEAWCSQKWGVKYPQGPRKVLINKPSAPKVSPPVPAAPAPSRAAPKEAGKPLADQVADRFAAHLASLRMSFLTNERLSALRKEVRDFAVKYEPVGMTAADKEKLLAGVDRYLAMQFRKRSDQPVAQSEEWNYLWLPDKLRTFEWTLWVSLTRKPLTPEQVKFRDEQRKWLQGFLETIAIRPGDAAPVEGMEPEQVRPWSVRQVDQAFADPFSLLFDPLTKKQFENFKRLMGGSALNGFSHTVAAVPLHALQVRVQPHPATADQTFNMPLPFDDKPVSLRGDDGGFVLFASNDSFQPKGQVLNGWYVYTTNDGRKGQQRPVFDAIGGTTVQVAGEIAGELPDVPAVAQWLQRQGKGDFVYLGKPDTLQVVRGARLAVLNVRGWIEADKLSDSELRKQIADHGQASVSLKPLLPMNGPHRFGEDPRIIVAVETAEQRLAVAILDNREFGQIIFGCRARPLAKPVTKPLPTRLPLISAARPILDAVRNSKTLAVLVTRAVEAPKETGGGSESKDYLQSFHVIETLAGELAPGQNLEIEYLWGPGRRTVEKGEQVIWVVGVTDRNYFDHCRGWKVLEDSPQARQATVDAIARAGGKSHFALPAIRQQLQSSDSEQRKYAGHKLHALANPADAESGAALVRVLADPEASVRLTVVRALGEMKYRPAGTKLLELLNDADGRVIEASCRALGCIGETRAFEPLVAMLESPKQGYPSAAVDGLGDLGDRRAVPVLVRFVRETKNPHLSPKGAGYPDNPRCDALAALAKLGDPAGMDAMIAALDDGWPLVRRTAADGLRRLDFPRYVEITLEKAVAQHAEATKVLANVKPRESLGGIRFEPWSLRGLSLRGDGEVLLYSAVMEDLVERGRELTRKGKADELNALLRAAAKHLDHERPTYRAVACELLAHFPQQTVELDLTPAVGKLLADGRFAFDGVSIGEGQRTISMERLPKGMSVADVARIALGNMTTIRFPTAKDFEAWWPKNQEYRRRLWYWAARWQDMQIHHQREAVLKELEAMPPAEALRLVLLTGNLRAREIDAGLPLIADPAATPVREARLWTSSYYLHFPPEVIVGLVRKHGLKDVMLRIVAQDPSWPEAKDPAAAHELLSSVTGVLEQTLDKSDAPAIVRALENPRGTIARDLDLLNRLGKAVSTLDPALAEPVLVAQLKQRPELSGIAGELVRRTGLKHWSLIQASATTPDRRRPVVLALAELGTAEAVDRLGQWFSAENWTPELTSAGAWSDLEREFLFWDYVKAAATVNGNKPVIGEDLVKRCRWHGGKEMKQDEAVKLNKVAQAARAEAVAQLKEFFAKTARKSAAGGDTPALSPEELLARATTALKAVQLRVKNDRILQPLQGATVENHAPQYLELRTGTSEAWDDFPTKGEPGGKKRENGRLRISVYADLLSPLPATPFIPPKGCHWSSTWLSVPGTQACVLVETVTSDAAAQQRLINLVTEELARTGITVTKDEHPPTSRAQELRATLLAATSKKHQREESIAALEKLGLTLGSSEAAVALRDFLTSELPDRHCKVEAIIALGRIGNKPAIAAIEDFERWSQARGKNPPPFRFGMMESPFDRGWTQNLRPAAEARDAKGQTWGVFWWIRWHENQVWLARQIDKAAGTWAEPRLVPIVPPDLNKPLPKIERFAVDGQSVTITLAGKEWKFAMGDTRSLLEVTKAKSKSVLKRAETVTSGPVPPRPAVDLASDEAQIRQAVFTLTFATSNSRDALLLVRPGKRAKATADSYLAGRGPIAVEPESAETVEIERAGQPPPRPLDFTDQRYFGHAGPILQVDEIADGANNVTNIAVRITSPTTATAYAEHWVGNMGAGGTVLELKKIDGKWVVVKRGATWIS